MIHGGDIYRNKVELDFSINVNPLGMPERVRQALVEAVNACTKYPDIEAQRLKKQCRICLASRRIPCCLEMVHRNCFKW